MLMMPSRQVAAPPSDYALRLKTQQELREAAASSSSSATDSKSIDSLTSSSVEYRSFLASWVES